MEVCQICKQKMYYMSDFHCNTHDITLEEYREKYGKVIDNNFYFLPRRPQAEIDYIGYHLGRKDKERRKAIWYKK